MIAKKGEATRLMRKQAVGMDELVDMYIRSMKISSGLNTQRIFAAWDEASGAARYTTRKFFRNGTLYVSMSSSVVRGQLWIQRAGLVEKINGILREDNLFIKDDPRVGYVKTLVLK